MRNVLKKSTSVKVVDKEAAGGGRENYVPLEQVYDDHFAGRYQALASWVKEAFEHNFGPFFGALRDLLQARTALLQSASPKAPPGVSGASSSAPASKSAL